jgi:uncharacterized cysteine cluster protein YcgN (CxxCxxCC family)
LAQNDNAQGIQRKTLKKASATPVAATLDSPFWKTKALTAMTDQEWESLCDGCGKCCLHKVQIKGIKLKITNVACRLLDLDTCQCGNYARRKTLVPDCVVLKPENVSDLSWLPGTCAYRLLSEKKDLPAWHPLVSGNSETVHDAQVSVRGRVVSERDAGELVQHIVAWPDY